MVQFAPLISVVMHTSSGYLDYNRCIYLFFRIAISLNAEAAVGGSVNQKHNIGM